MPACYAYQGSPHASTASQSQSEKLLGWLQAEWLIASMHVYQSDWLELAEFPQSLKQEDTAFMSWLYSQ